MAEYVFAVVVAPLVALGLNEDELVLAEDVYSAGCIGVAPYPNCRSWQSKPDVEVSARRVKAILQEAYPVADPVHN